MKTAGGCDVCRAASRILMVSGMTRALFRPPKGHVLPEKVESTNCSDGFQRACRVAPGTSGGRGPPPILPVPKLMDGPFRIVTAVFLPVLDPSL
jgi:hypothetical protein